MHFIQKSKQIQNKYLKSILMAPKWGLEIQQEMHLKNTHINGGTI